MTSFNKVDEKYYLEEYQDVKKEISAGTFVGGARAHYDLYGGREMRNPNAWFDARYYKDHNQDVATAVDARQSTNVFAHYLLHGVGEGRAMSQAAADVAKQWDDDDEKAYLAANEDVANAVRSGDAKSGKAHFVTFGCQEIADGLRGKEGVDDDFLKKLARIPVTTPPPPPPGQPTEPEQPWLTPRSEPTKTVNLTPGADKGKAYDFSTWDGPVHFKAVNDYAVKNGLSFNAAADDIKGSKATNDVLEITVKNAKKATAVNFADSGQSKISGIEHVKIIDGAKNQDGVTYDFASTQVEKVSRQGGDSSAQFTHLGTVTEAVALAVHAPTTFDGLADGAKVIIKGEDRATKQSTVGDVKFSTQSNTAQASLTLEGVHVDKVSRTNTKAQAFTIHSKGPAANKIEKLDLDSSNSHSLKSLTIDAETEFTATLDPQDCTANSNSTLRLKGDNHIVLTGVAFGKTTVEDSSTATMDIQLSPMPALARSSALRRTVQGGGGNDKIDGSHLGSVEALSADGGGGNDTIIGGEGKDTINGGKGVDQLTGGGGQDTFVFKTGDSSCNAYDTITDYNGWSIWAFLIPADLINVLDNSGRKVSLAAATGPAATPAQGSASIQSAKAHFVSGDDTLVKKFTAIANTMGAEALGHTAYFVDNQSTYVFISDGKDGLQATDIVVKLQGFEANYFTGGEDAYFGY